MDGLECGCECQNKLDYEQSCHETVTREAQSIGVDDEDHTRHLTHQSPTGKGGGVGTAGEQIHDIVIQGGRNKTGIRDNARTARRDQEQVNRKPLADGLGRVTMRRRVIEQVARMTNRKNLPQNADAGQILRQVLIIQSRETME